jgi:hypothetical protein
MADSFDNAKRSWETMKNLFDYLMSSNSPTSAGKTAVKNPTPMTPTYRDPNTGDVGSQPSNAQERATMVTGAQNRNFSAPKGGDSHAITEQNSMRALGDYQSPYKAPASPFVSPNPYSAPSGPAAPQSYRQAEINSMNQLGQKQLASKQPTTTGRVSSGAAPRTQAQAPAAAPQASQTYYLDRGNGSPLVPMGSELPKNMFTGPQQGGGFIFGTPAPTKSIFGGSSQPQPKSDLSKYPSADVPTPTPRPSDLQASDGMASGGSIDRASKIAREKATPCHDGIINMAVGGRTDHIPMNVLEGSYVLPADIVSGLGEGNTLAGSKILDNMFKGGPFGTEIPTARATPRIPSLSFGKTTQPQAQASGGRTNSVHSKPVPIIAAGGEYVVHPDVVAKLGNGNMDDGHEYLDNFVKYVRAHTAKTLQNLPGPRKD